MQDHFAQSVRYTSTDYEKLRNTYRRWWQGELNRPIVPIVTTGHASWRKPSSYPLMRFGTAWDASIKPQDFVDAHDYHLSTLRWHGDAYPYINFDAFGPGVLAAFLGCTPIGRQETVWFAPPEKDIPIEQMHFSLNENNPCLRRVLNVYEAAMEKWRGAVVLGMADLGGIMDVLASFRGSENLLMDLYDAPDEVLRCVRELQEMWFRCYKMILDVIGSEAMGYSQWFNLYGEQPGYILQSDFSYMIGSEMFDVFVAPELASSAARLEKAVYHLDGVGEIRHLDSLLKIDGIKGIQWVPGAGAAEDQDWSELLARILQSGKKLLSCAQKPDGTPIDIATDPGQLYFSDRYFPCSSLDEAKRYGEMYGIAVD